MNKVSKASVAYALVIGGLMSSGAAMAGVSVGVNIGVPAPVYVAPAPMYAPPPPPVVYAPPPAPIYAQPAIVIGWHGDRYYDGRRYWDRDDWYRHNGRGHAYGHENHGHHGWHWSPRDDDKKTTRGWFFLCPAQSTPCARPLACGDRM